MKKIVVINCEFCPFSWLEVDSSPDYDYNIYQWTCTHPSCSGDPDGRFINIDKGIPNWCPLEEN